MNKFKRMYYKKFSKDMLIDIIASMEDDLKEYDILLGLRGKRTLIAKFDKEFDEEDKLKNPNRDYAAISPDAEEVYRRYYSQKEEISNIKKELDILNKIIRQSE